MYPQFETMEFKDQNDRMTRGGIYYTRIHFVREKYGTGGMQRLYNKMKEYGYNGPATEDEIKIADWYPHSYDILFLKAFKELFGESAFKRMARTVPRISGGVSDLFLKWPDNPNKLIKEGVKYWHMFYNFGRLESEVLDGGKGIIRGYGISTDPIFCELLTYYFQGLLEKAGALNVEVEHTHCVHRGDKFEEWKLTWSALDKSKNKKFSKIEWDKSLETGIDEIDEQHKYFVKILNEINIRLNNKDKGLLLEMLYFMDKYAHWHFSSEEKYMKKYNYPDYLKHHAEHERFYNYTKETIIEAKRGLDEHLEYSVNKYLIDWLINHIMGTDKKFANFLRDNNLVMENERMPSELEKVVKSTI